MTSRTHRQDASGQGTWHVYLLSCADGTLYCGIARDVGRRVAQHNGQAPGGARYTSGRRPVRLVWSRPCASRSDAQRRETRIKSMSRAQKLACIGDGSLDG
jgi:putative endonuclease